MTQPATILHDATYYYRTDNVSVLFKSLPDKTTGYICEQILI